MKTRSEIFTEFLVRNNRTTTDGFITDTTLSNWLGNAHTWACAYKKWPFTEGRVQTTYTTGSGPDTDEFYFEGYKSDSFRIITVGGKRLTKLTFDDYRILREERPEATDRVFSDFGRTVFINPNADVSGTTVAYGQYLPVIDLSVATTETAFSNWDDEGNEAIIEKMTAYLKRREHLAQEAELHDQRASAKLEEVWKRIQDEQYAYQTTPERGGMWKRVDIIEGDYEDEIFKRDRF